MADFNDDGDRRFGDDGDAREVDARERRVLRDEQGSGSEVAGRVHLPGASGHETDRRGQRRSTEQPAPRQPAEPERVLRVEAPERERRTDRPRTGPGRTERDRTGPGRAERNWTGPGRPDLDRGLADRFADRLRDVRDGLRAMAGLKRSEDRTYTGLSDDLRDGSVDRNEPQARADLGRGDEYADFAMDQRGLARGDERDADALDAEALDAEADAREHPNDSQPEQQQAEQLPRDFTKETAPAAGAVSRRGRPFRGRRAAGRIRGTDRVRERGRR